MIDATEAESLAHTEYNSDPVILEMLGTLITLWKRNAELKTENERRLVQFEELVPKLKRLQTVSTAAKVMCKDQSRTYDEGQIQFKALKAALAALDAPHAGEEE